MARLIVKSPYIKCGAGQSAGGYLKWNDHENELNYKYMESSM